MLSLVSPSLPLTTAGPSASPPGRGTDAIFVLDVPGVATALPDVPTERQPVAAGGATLPGVAIDLSVPVLASSIAPALPGEGAGLVDPSLDVVHAAPLPARPILTLPDTGPESPPRIAGDVLFPPRKVPPLPIPPWATPPLPGPGGCAVVIPPLPLGDDRSPTLDPGTPSTPVDPEAAPLPVPILGKPIAPFRPDADPIPDPVPVPVPVAVPVAVVARPIAPVVPEAGVLPTPVPGQPFVPADPTVGPLPTPDPAKPIVRADPEGAPVLALPIAPVDKKKGPPPASDPVAPATDKALLQPVAGRPVAPVEAEIASPPAPTAAPVVAAVAAAPLVRAVLPDAAGPAKDKEALALTPVIANPIAPAEPEDTPSTSLPDPGTSKLPAPEMTARPRSATPLRFERRGGPHPLDIEPAEKAEEASSQPEAAVDQRPFVPDAPAAPLPSIVAPLPAAPAPAPDEAAPPVDGKAGTVAADADALPARPVLREVARPATTQPAPAAVANDASLLPPTVETRADPAPVAERTIDRPPSAPAWVPGKAPTSAPVVPTAMPAALPTTTSMAAQPVVAQPAAAQPVAVQPAPGSTTASPVAAPLSVAPAPVTPVAEAPVSVPTVAAPPTPERPVEAAARALPTASVSLLPEAAPRPVAAPAREVFAAAIERSRRAPASTATGGTAPAEMMAPVTPGALRPVAAAQDVPLDMAGARWTEDMVTRIERMLDHADAGDGRIRLRPDALGSVDLTVRSDGTQVHVHFRAEVAETRQLLRDAAPRLADAAEARGLQLGDASVSGGSSQGQGQEQGRQRDARPAFAAALPNRRAAREATADTTPEHRLA